MAKLAPSGTKSTAVRGVSATKVFTSFLLEVSYRMILLSRPMVTNSSSLTGEKQRPEAGALCVLSKLWYAFWLFTSQRVTTPLSETLPKRDFLNNEYLMCRTGCLLPWPKGVLEVFVVTLCKIISPLRDPEAM